MEQEQWAALALQAFDGIVTSQAGLRVRPGQRQMATQVAHTLAQATLGKPEEGQTAPTPSLAVIQAGTGIGKSLAYSAPAIAQALERGTRVLISTATVALQEQLVHKDLPILAAQLPTPFRYALAKGRGRFVCLLKLERMASTGSDDLEDLPDVDLFAPADAPPVTASHKGEQQVRMQLYGRMADALAQGSWDGDRDSLESQPEPEVWGPIAAESSSCTGRHCPVFNRCSYYERRKELVAAQVIVANHDLLLSSIGARLLPELDNCLLIFDEAHHLPATALAQFACHMDISRLQWLDKLSSRALRIGQLLEVEEIADIPQHSSGLRQHMQQLAQGIMEHCGETLRRQDPRFGPARVRLPQGQWPQPLLPPLEAIEQHASGLLTVLRAIAQALRAHIKEQPEQAPQLAALYAQLGSLAPKLEAVYDTASLLLPSADPATPPAAKWFTYEVHNDLIVLTVHASPILPGATLRQHLWSQVRGAVLTSATLTSCGNFDFFLREAGLYQWPGLQTLEVASPFDYAQQGQLIAHHTQADPRQAQAFTQEMVQTLMHDLGQVSSGALVLFTSREQMRQAVDTLPSHLRALVLVQNTMPRTSLLAQHRQRVQQGEVSIIFGMQSFGEGLDLPGAQCAALFITKLPFAPPDDPVGEARAEWLRSNGRNPFNDLVVPATAIRMAQWVGRAIRTEEDQAQVYCYDRRLLVTNYGQQVLKSLPPFTLTVRNHNLSTS